MVAAAVLKTAVLTDVWVRLPPPARQRLRTHAGDERGAQDRAAQFGAVLQATHEQVARAQEIDRGRPELSRGEVDRRELFPVSA